MEDAVDRKYAWRMALWKTVVIGWALLTLFMQTTENGSLRQEREYLRSRLFAEMNLRTEVMQAVTLQEQRHVLYELEIAGLRRQTEMLRAESYIARVNRRLSAETRWQIVSAVYSCSESVGLDPVLGLAVMEQESAFIINARSTAGARGLMQLMPRTAEQELSIPRAQITDIELNVCGGLSYLARHLRSHNGVQHAALRRYSGGYEAREYASPILARYTRIKAEVRR